jgi:TRAP transporter TAXI family solute receptor
MKRTLVMNIRPFLALVFAMAMPSGVAGAQTAAPAVVTIDGGYSTGLYYQSANAIAKIVNKRSQALGLRCTVVPSSGSVENVGEVVAGKVQFAYAQSDVQFQAWNGLGEWREKGPQKELRSVFALYPETLTLIAAEGSNIGGIKDLKGKRVNIGVLGSGQYEVSLQALRAAGLDSDGQITTTTYDSNEAPFFLQQEKIDAYFYVVGHPNMNVRQSTTGKMKKVRICEVVGPGIDAMLREKPYYVRTVIPMQFYPNAANTGDVLTFGVDATLVTSASVPDDVVYKLTKEVFENLDQFKRLVAAQWQLTKKSMLEGLTAPIHPGAMKYYKEAGLI